MRMNWGVWLTQVSVFLVRRTGTEGRVSKGNGIRPQNTWLPPLWDGALFNISYLVSISRMEKYSLYIMLWLVSDSASEQHLAHGLESSASSFLSSYSQFLGTCLVLPRKTWASSSRYSLLPGCGGDSIWMEWHLQDAPLLQASDCTWATNGRDGSL